MQVPSPAKRYTACALARPASTFDGPIDASSNELSSYASVCRGGESSSHLRFLQQYRKLPWCSSHRWKKCEPASTCHRHSHPPQAWPMYVVGTGPTGPKTNETPGQNQDQVHTTNATRAQNMPPRGGSRLPIEAHAATFPIVHLALVLLSVGRTRACPSQMKSELRCFRRSSQGGLESEILMKPNPVPDSG